MIELGRVCEPVIAKPSPSVEATNCRDASRQKALSLLKNCWLYAVFGSSPASLASCWNLAAVAGSARNWARGVWSIVDAPICWARLLAMAPAPVGLPSASGSSGNEPE